MIRSDKIVPPDRLLDDESARLKLAIIKENFQYRKLYREVENECSGPNQEQSKKCWGDFENIMDELGLHIEVGKILTYGIKFEELMQFLHPDKDLSEPLTSVASWLMERLPEFFYEPGVKVIMSIANIREYHRDAPDDTDMLLPHERLIKIDLRTRKSQILSEIAYFIDVETSFKEYLDGKNDWDTRGYLLWEAENSRQRKEAWKQLEVWHLRKQCIPFKQIAQQLKIKIDLVKKRFYAAYELTQGRRYDQDYWWEIRERIKAERIKSLKGLCKDCSDRKKCKALCPKAMEYVEQDVASSTREYLGNSISLT